jgi:hypothetical protein
MGQKKQKFKSNNNRNLILQLLGSKAQCKEKDRNTYRLMILSSLSSWEQESTERYI